MLRSRTSSGTLSLIPDATATLPDSGRSQRAVRGASERPAPRDHALSLHRFVGGVQLLGGATLIAAYALGGDAVALGSAPTLLVALGVLQVIVGLGWMLRTARLRAFVKRRPGTLVAATATPAIVVAALGGSGVDTLWITSTECWLIAAGAVLPMRGLIVTTAIGSAIATVAWVALDGSAGGYDGDGNYLIATIALAKVLVIGLWLGRVTGATWSLLERWHVIEQGERGIVQLLSAQLARVDAAASAMGERLAAVPEAAAELLPLRARLQSGVGLRDAGDTITVGDLVLELRQEHVDAAFPVDLNTDVAPGAEAVELAVGAADATVSVIRRQIANVVRHAPAATTVTLAVDRNGEDLRILVDDDGGGTAPTQLGTGSRWSSRQLARVGGTASYYDGARGVGFQAHVPVAPPTELSGVPELSVRAGLDRFASGMIAALRWASYIGDTLVAQSVDGVGDRWLLMPIGAALIEYAIQRGLPGLRLNADQRRTLGSVLAVALVLVFTVPADSPAGLVPASTSVVVLADLLLRRQTGMWAALEVVRGLAVLPLITRGGAGAIEVVVIYPLAFNLLIFGVRRFIDRAGGLERSVLDASGRAALTSATLHGLALHHDAVDVLLRAGPDDPELRANAADLEDAVRDLQRTAAGSLDPREIVRSGVEAALGVPVHVEPGGGVRRGVATTAAGAIDRVTLLEIAALAADERASCTPPGMLGRRRLQSVALRWEQLDAGRISVTLIAEPTLGQPDPRKVTALETVATALGVEVRSDDDALVLVYGAA